jgi:hypothetical protein
LSGGAGGTLTRRLAAGDSLGRLLDFALSLTEDLRVSEHPLGRLEIAQGLPQRLRGRGQSALFNIAAGRRHVPARHSWRIA